MSHENGENGTNPDQGARQVRIIDWLVEKAAASFRKNQTFTVDRVPYVYTLETACFNSFAGLGLNIDDLRSVLEEQSPLEEVLIDVDPDTASTEEVTLRVCTALIRDQAIRTHPELALEELQREMVSPERQIELN